MSQTNNQSQNNANQAARNNAAQQIRQAGNNSSLQSLLVQKSEASELRNMTKSAAESPTNKVQ